MFKMLVVNLFYCVFSVLLYLDIGEKSIFYQRLTNDIPSLKLWGCVTDLRGTEGEGNQGARDMEKCVCVERGEGASKQNKFIIKPTNKANMFYVKTIM